MNFDVLQEIGILYRGIILGFMVAAPVGPVGLLCIRRTIQKGLAFGFATGFGAAFADAFFSAIAAFGVAFVMEIVRSHTQPIYILGGSFLLFVAWHTWHDNPHLPKSEAPEEKILARFGVHLTGIAKSVVSSFVITLTNPATMFGILALIATFGGLRGRTEASTLVGGIFIGSSLWWLLLSGITSLLRKRFTKKGVLLINRLTAVALTPLALWALMSGLAGFWK